MKNKLNVKTIVFASLSILLFSGSLVCSIFCGANFQNNPSNAIKLLIDSECKKVECGEAIFSEVQYINNKETITKINSFKNKFDSPLYNQLSKAEFNAEISAINYFSSGISIIETKAYDMYYDTLHVYSDTGWIHFDENLDNVYISTTLEKSIINGTGIKSAVGQPIVISVNDVTLSLRIGGTVSTEFYPKIKGRGPRADGIKNAIGETIYMHEETLLKFLPTKAIAMFSSDSPVNGEKYINLKDFANINHFQFEFNLNPLEGSTLANDISSVEAYMRSDSRRTVAIILLLSAIILTVSFFASFVIFLKNINLKDDQSKRCNVLTAIIYGVLLVTSLMILLIFKFNPIIIQSYIKIPMINSMSIIMIAIILLLVVAFFSIRQRRTVAQLFKEKKDNSEIEYPENK